jgi:NAD(P)-dependent dehydrogenase (short-subunit alcohol dehydrogenase family)
LVRRVLVVVLPIVEALLARDARKVYATARRVETLADLTTDPRVAALSLDITDADEVAAAATAAGDVTLRVNNGGSLEFADLFNGELSAIQTDPKTNYFGTLAVTRAFVPILQRHGGGAIVNLRRLPPEPSHGAGRPLRRSCRSRLAACCTCGTRSAGRYSQRSCAWGTRSGARR